MTFTFRPTIEILDARDLPAVTLENAWVTSAKPTPPPAEVHPFAPAPTPVQPLMATYDLKALKKV